MKQRLSAETGAEQQPLTGGMVQTSTSGKYSPPSLGGGQTVQQLQDKTLSLQWFMLPTHSASTTLQDARGWLLHNEAVFQRFVLTSKARRKY